MPSAVKLDELATYLDCSVDYLLGRTDEPKSTAKTLQSNSIDNSVNIDPAPAPDSTTQQLADTFNQLSFEDKIKAMNYVLELKNKE